MIKSIIVKKIYETDKKNAEQEVTLVVNNQRFLIVTNNQDSDLTSNMRMSNAFPSYNL